MPQLSVIVALLIGSHTGLSASAVDRLKRDVAAIYAAADVEVRWTEEAAAGAVPVRVVAAMPAIEGCESAFGCAVAESGSASSRPSVAFVASGAVWDYERPRPLLRGKLLGYVVAHEIGHLLGLGHSRERGLMYRELYWLSRARWTREDRAALSSRLRTGTALASNPAPLGATLSRPQETGRRAERR